MHLADVFTAPCAAGDGRRREAHVEGEEVVFPPAGILRTWTAEDLSIVALLNPARAQGRQSASQFNTDIRICVRAGCIVNGQRRIFFGAITVARRRERDLSTGYTQIRTAATKVT